MNLEKHLGWGKRVAALDDSCEQAWALLLAGRCVALA